MQFKTLSPQERADVYGKISNRGAAFLQSTKPQLRPMEGNNIIRFCPTRPDDTRFPGVTVLGLPIKRYYVDGVGSFVSPMVCGTGLVDPIQLAMRELETHQIETKDIVSASNRYLCQIIDFTRDNQNGEMALWCPPASAIDDAIAVTQSPFAGTQGTLSLEDVNEGHVVFFRWGKNQGGFLVASNWQIDPNVWPIPPAYLQHLECYGDILVIEDEAKLQEIANGILTRGQASTGRVSSASGFAPGQQPRGAAPSYAPPPGAGQGPPSVVPDPHYAPPGGQPGYGAPPAASAPAYGPGGAPVSHGGPPTGLDGNGQFAQTPFVPPGDFAPQAAGAPGSPQAGAPTQQPALPGGYTPPQSGAGEPPGDGFSDEVRRQIQARLNQGQGQS